MSKSGGGGSGNLNKSNRGPNKTSFIGYKIFAKVLSQAIDEASPGKGSPLNGNNCTCGPKTELDIN